MSYVQPFNLMQWIDANREALKPPVGNRQLWQDKDFIVSIVGGPNERTDYHDDPYEEFFFQLKGNMVLRIWENGGPKDIPVREGEVFMLPPHVPHSPQRPHEGSYGLIVERVRPKGVKDAFEWYCEACNAKLYRRELEISSLDELPRVFKDYAEQPALRKCKACGCENSLKPRRPAAA